MIVSSYWIANPSRLSFIFKQVYYALYCFENGYSLPNGQIVRETINNNDIEKAKILIEKYNLIHFLDNSNTFACKSRFTISFIFYANIKYNFRIT